MDKLYYIVCEDKSTTLFEGRFQGRTRGAALKYLKEQVGMNSLNGVVFTITEIPIPIIREVVTKILAELEASAPPEVPAPAPPVPDPRPASPVRSNSARPSSRTRRRRRPSKKTGAKVGNPGYGDDFWDEARAYWIECRNTRLVAERFGIPRSSVKTRALRERWKEGV